MCRCIYRKAVLNHNHPEDDDTQSDEHVIPWSLGGSNGLVTPDASKRANNDLGSEVDARFADTLPLAIKRHQLQLKSQRGNIPPIVWRGEDPATTVVIDADGTMEIKFEPSVDRPPNGENGPITISGARDQVERILQGMLKGMKKRNQVSYSEDGALLESLDDFWNASDQSLVNRVRLKVEYFNHEAWTWGVLKIVLGTGHLILGADWSFGPDAEIIRQYVMNGRANWPRSGRGIIAGEWHRALRVVLGKTAAIRDANEHTVAILPSQQNGDGIAAISLFGGNGVPEALVRIGKLPKRIIESLNGENYNNTLLGFRVNPASRITTPILFAEIDQRVRTQGPTNKRSRNVYWERYRK